MIGGRVAPLSLSTHEASPSLPPTAQRIIEAARRLLAREGFAALTLQAIASEAGEHKASIGYYFGDKAGLIAVLADSTSREVTANGLKALRQLPSGPERIRTAVATNRAVSSDVEGNRVWFDILAHALRAPTLTRRLASAYEDYREINLRMLTEADDEETRSRVAPVASLCLAVLDGLALQTALDPEGFDLGSAYAAWESLLNMFSAHLGNVGEPAG